MSLVTLIESTINQLLNDIMTAGNEKAIIDDLVKETAKKLSKTIEKKLEKKSAEKIKSKKTVYQIFCEKNRDKTLSFVEANRALSQKWKALSDEEKTTFAESVKAEIDADAERFNAEKASLSSSPSSPSSRDSKTKKDPNAPKRPLSSFMLFCKEQRERDPTLKGIEASKRMSTLWKDLSDKEKDVYKEQSKVLMDSFKSHSQDNKKSDETDETHKKVKETKKVKEEVKEEVESDNVQTEKKVKETKKVKEEVKEENDEKVEKVETGKKGKKTKKVKESDEE